MKFEGLPRAEDAKGAEEKAPFKAYSVRTLAMAPKAHYKGPRRICTY